MSKLVYQRTVTDQQGARTRVLFYCASHKPYAAEPADPVFSALVEGVGGKCCECSRIERAERIARGDNASSWKGSQTWPERSAA